MAVDTFQQAWKLVWSRKHRTDGQHARCSAHPRGLIDQVYPFPIRPSVALSYASRYPAGNGNGNSRNGGVEELLGM